MMPEISPEQPKSFVGKPFPVAATSDFIEDPFGVAIVLCVGQTRQVFRWIAPGSFGWR